MTDGSGHTSYTYDNDGQLTKVTNGGGQVVSYGYNADSSLTTITYPNGKTSPRLRQRPAADLGHRLEQPQDHRLRLRQRRQPDQRDLPERDHRHHRPQRRRPGHLHHRHHLRRHPLASFTYTRGNDGELATATTAGTAISAPAQTYTYNPLSQLTADNTTSDGYDHAGDPTTLGRHPRPSTRASELATHVTGGTTTTATATTPAATAPPPPPAAPPPATATTRPTS